MTSRTQVGTGAGHSPLAASDTSDQIFKVLLATVISPAVPVWAEDSFPKPARNSRHKYLLALAGLDLRHPRFNIGAHCEHGNALFFAGIGFP